MFIIGQGSGKCPETLPDFALKGEHLPPILALVMHRPSNPLLERIVLFDHCKFGLRGELFSACCLQKKKHTERSLLLIE